MSLKTFLHTNQIATGIVVGLGLELIVGLILYLGLTIADISIVEHVKWFAVIFVLPIFALRYYVKKTQYHKVIKTLMVLLFATFIAYMFILL